MTILGQYSIEELQDLIKNKDATIAEVENAWVAVRPSWESSNPSAAADWLIDWTALKGRYESAHAQAQMAITIAGAMIGVRNSVIPAQDTYMGISQSLTRGQGGTYIKGDIQDLYNRIKEARGGQDIKFSNPQPTAIDFDADVYTATDSLIRSGEKAAKAAEESNMKYYVGGGLLALLGLAVITRR